jgi:hypothetical protein
LSGGGRNAITGIHAYTCTFERVLSCHAARENRSARIGRWRFGKYTASATPVPFGSA